jgi:prokaryotic ubiquitin-like protein Pup
MPERKREQKPAPKERERELDDEVAAPAESEKAEKLKGDIDDLLDEIDSVLEDNAEDFVRNYVQKGGQ